MYWSSVLVTFYTLPKVGYTYNCILLAKALPRSVSMLEHWLICCRVSSFSLHSAVGMGTGSGGGGYRGDGEAQLPGHGPRRLHHWFEEVHRVLHLGVMLHHARRRAPEPPPAPVHA